MRNPVTRLARRKSATGAAALGLLLSLAGCGGSDPDPKREGNPDGAGGGSPPLTLTDDSGVERHFSAPPRRIVSLVPSATETLIALGAVERLIARTDFDTASVLLPLPSVGEGILPSVERLLTLEPDLVIYFSGETSRALTGRLENHGLRHFGVRPDRMDNVRRVIEALGAIVDRSRAADSLLNEIDETLRGVRERVEGQPRPRVVYLLGGTPPWVAGPGTFIEELIEAVGGTNVFSDLELLYGAVSPEELLAREIDVIFAQEGVAVEIPLEDTPIRRVSSLILRPGPRVAEAALELAKLLHPHLF